MICISFGAGASRRRSLKSFLLSCSAIVFLGTGHATQAAGLSEHAAGGQGFGSTGGDGGGGNGRGGGGGFFAGNSYNGHAPTAGAGGNGGHGFTNRVPTNNGSGGAGPGTSLSGSGTYMGGPAGGNGTNGTVGDGGGLNDEGGGGGGGGGGAGLFYSPLSGETYNFQGSANGGNGGNGGDGGPFVGSNPYDGGGGGGGGAALWVDGGNATLSIGGGYTLTGGNGGRGGDGGNTNGRFGGGGGGGDGFLLLGNGNTITNAGALEGGDGGADGAGSTGIGGTGGSGLRVLGNNNVINNFGTLQGGLSGNGAVTAHAFMLDGADNAISLHATSVLDGAAYFAGSSNTLDLAGVINGYQSAALQLDGTDSTVTLRAGALINGSVTIAGSGHSLDLSGTITGNLTPALKIDGSGSTVTLNASSIIHGAVQMLGSANRLALGGVINGNLTVSSGVLTTGGGIASATVNGNIVMAPGGTLEVDANPDGSADRLIATGTIDLGGAGLSILAGAGTWQPQTSFNIVQAASLTGTFGSMTTNLAFLTPSLSYSATGVALNLLRNDISFASVAATANQRAVARTLDGFGSGQVYDAIVPLAGADARSAFDDLSGEIHGAVNDVILHGGLAVIDTMSERMALGDTMTGSASSGTFWGDLRGQRSQVAGDGNFSRTTNQGGGLTIGGDGSLGDWRVGLLAGYDHSTLRVAGRESSASMDGFYAGAYADTALGNVMLRSGLLAGLHQLESKRHVMIGGLSQALTADYDARSAQAFGELAYRLDLDGMAVEPFAGVTLASIHNGGYSEQGGSAALTAGGSTRNGAATTLGVRLASEIDLGTAQLTARGMVGWRHMFGNVATANHGFAGSAAFTVEGAARPKDFAVVELGLDLSLTPAVKLGVDYTAGFASGSSTHTVSAGLSAKF